MEPGRQTGFDASYSFIASLLLSENNDVVLRVLAYHILESFSGHTNVN